jgi:clan AA aspartic protease
MGLVYSEIQLSNPVLPDLKPLQVKCLVDSGSTYLCIPSHIANQLNLMALETREATLANGESETVPYVGPVKITFENRNCFVGALVLGNEVLLGAVPMEDMDLVIQPKLLKLTVNPDSPNIARGHVK